MLIFMTSHNTHTVLLYIHVLHIDVYRHIYHAILCIFLKWFYLNNDSGITRPRPATSNFGGVSKNHAVEVGFSIRVYIILLQHK